MHALQHHSSDSCVQYTGMTTYLKAGIFRAILINISYRRYYKNDHIFAVHHLQCIFTIQII